MLSVFAASAMFAAPALAQDAPEPDAAEVEEIEEEEVAEEDEERVVVTGSRVRKSTFSSISPLQTITTEDSASVGLFDAAQILQTSEAAAGQQIDATFNGFVLDNGPGSQTINLRGLSAERTLVLINGRRVAPSGVEGAPISPSINYLPGSLVERYDLLLDGASSVYGSDAVAGVVNVVMRNDFDGFEFSASGDYPEQGGGRDYTLSTTWGQNNDRGFIGVGAEYDFREAVTLGDRDFFSGCTTDYEVTGTGEIRRQVISDTLYNGVFGQEYEPYDCLLGGLGARIRRVPGGLGFVYYTPGETNTGIPNFSESSLYGIPLDGDGDGVSDVNFANYSPNGEFNDATFISEQKRLSLMAYGEYTLAGPANITPYFEALYTDVEVFADSGAAQLFTVVPATNPYNPCNPDAVNWDGNGSNGVDCGLAADSVLNNPVYLENFRRYYHDTIPELGRGVDFPNTCPRFGVPREFCTPATFGLLNGALGAQRAGGGVVVEGDRDKVYTSVAQIRAVGGVRGDLPMINFGSVRNWSFDTSFVYTKSDGDASRPGIRDDRLHYALGFDPLIRNATGGLVDLAGGACDAAFAEANNLDPDIADGCVPVNLFAPSLYEGIIGDFATQAERDYLFDTRDFNTVYEQYFVTGIVNGDVFELPGGTMTAALGFEYRIDNLESNPDQVAAEGLFFGFFSDQGAVGDKFTREVFVEVDMPLLASKPFAEELELNISGRYTDDEYYGGNSTYSIKAGWRPISPLLIKSSFGTSFRAPSLRENFLLGTSGFGNIFDPCITPDVAVGIDGSYNPELDPREPDTLDNCRRDGIDPTNFSPVAGNIQTLSTEITTGGALDLEPETSESFTVGLAVEQPFFDSFDLSFNVNFYDIVVDDSIVEPGSQFIVNDCYTRLIEDGVSPFCSRITRQGSGGVEPGRISLIDAGFINQARETVSGLDYNIDFATEATILGQPWDFSVDLRANQLKERTTLFIDDNGNATSEEFLGDFSYPEWTGSVLFNATKERYRFTWETRYVGAVSQDPEGVDPFSDAYDSLDTGFVGNTCAGTVFATDTLCRDVGYSDEILYHSASVRFVEDTWSVTAGVRNLTNETPSLVSPNEIFSVGNVPLGAGYDYDGRQYFATFRYQFN